MMAALLLAFIGCDIYHKEKSGKKLDSVKVEEKKPINYNPSLDSVMKSYLIEKRYKVVNIYTLRIMPRKVIDIRFPTFGITCYYDIPVSYKQQEEFLITGNDSNGTEMYSNYPTDPTWKKISDSTLEMLKSLIRKL